jgi:hypothetical protein
MHKSMSLGTGLQIHIQVLKTWLHWIKVFHVLCYTEYGSLFHPICDGHTVGPRLRKIIPSHRTHRRHRTVTVARHSNKESFVFRMCPESDLELLKHWDQIRSWSVQTVIMTVKIISFGLRRQLANERVTVTGTYLFKSGCVARINIPWPWPWQWQWKWRSSVSARRTVGLRGQLAKVGFEVAVKVKMKVTVTESRSRSRSRSPGHGHGHGHGLFILTTYYEGKWTTNPNKSGELGC